MLNLLFNALEMNSLKCYWNRYPEDGKPEIIVNTPMCGWSIQYRDDIEKYVVFDDENGFILGYWNDYCAVVRLMNLLVHGSV